MFRLIDILHLLRPQEWIKNTFVFAALIFSQQLLNVMDVLKVIGAFVLFCMVSGVIYIINDIFDLEHDRVHPIKKDRPLASGRINISLAWLLAVILVVISMTFSFALQPNFMFVLVLYFLINFAYSLYLKGIVIVDVMTLAFGFVLRAIAGGVVIQVPVSSWLIVCTALISLFLGFGKRRHELILLDEEAGNHRSILREYSPYFLDQMISVVTASSVIAYTFYTMSEEVQEKLHTHYLGLTIPFVLYGIFRYLYLVHQKQGGGNPAQELLADRPLLINGTLWVLAVIVILYDW
ncbi:MAG: decaprenyl-phosphate phosphoribosyltransferase [Candidatus Scalinduaceae bacterium]